MFVLAYVLVVRAKESLLQPEITDVCIRFFNLLSVVKRLLLIICFTLALPVIAQTPSRTVKFSPPLSGIPNHTTISEALQNAASSETIWIAAGLYQEDELIVPAGITLIGGFPPTSIAYNQRIYPGVTTTAQQSILDGNYEHRVATVFGTLDGFVITKGYVFDDTETTPLKGAGGGVLINGGIVQNSIITNNVASRVPPSPTVIPGSFVASIGDVYCKGLNGTNDTILKPTYAFNQSTGQLEAELVGGIPANKVVQGIVYFVDPAPTNRSVYVVGRRSPTERTWSGSYTFDCPNLTNYSNVNTASADMEGETNTATVLNYVNSQIPIWNATYQGWRTTSWNENAAFRYVETYNLPTGTLGEWYLLSAGELIKLTDVRTQMDACAVELGWILSGGTMFSNDVYLSSTEKNASTAWGFNAYSDWQNLGLSEIGKTAPGFAFPVVKKQF